jgi:hypothetical protein
VLQIRMRVTTKHLMRTRRLDINAHAQIRKNDLNQDLTRKNYEMCENRAEVKQDDIGVF